MVRSAIASEDFKKDSKTTKITVLVEEYGDRTLVLVDERERISCLLQVTDPSLAPAPQSHVKSADGIPHPSPGLETTMLMGTAETWIEEFYATHIATLVTTSVPRFASRPVVIGLGLVPGLENDITKERIRLLAAIRATEKSLLSFTNMT